MVRAAQGISSPRARTQNPAIYDPVVAEDDWIDPAEAARLLNLPERIVYTLIEEGKVPAARWPVRIRRADLDLCLEACRIKPGDLAHLNRYRDGPHRYRT
jgi:excisionase family DNA binding protein